MKRLLLKAYRRFSKFSVVLPVEPIPKKCVMIAYPHTTNWDFPAMLSVAEASNLSVKWLGKKQLFWGPLGPLMRALGGVSVERSSSQGLVNELAEEFARRDQFALVIPAEGTRSEVEYWKSGFYRIALAAKVPILCSFVDGTTNTGGLGIVLTPTGDMAADMDRVRAFYAGKTGLKPGKSAIPRLREETSPSIGSASTDPA